MDFIDWLKEDEIQPILMSHQVWRGIVTIKVAIGRNSYSYEMAESDLSFKIIKMLQGSKSKWNAINLLKHNSKVTNLNPPVQPKVNKINTATLWSPEYAEGINPEFDPNPEIGLGAVSDNMNIGYFGFIVYMKPSDFLKLNPTREVSDSVDFIYDQIAKGRKLGPPFLSVKYDEQRHTFKVYSHEGRGRMLALLKHGYDNEVPVHIFPRNANGGELRARHLSEKDLFSLFLSDDRCDKMFSCRIHKAILDGETYTK